MGHFLLIIPTETSELPNGYQTPGTTLDYIVDMRGVNTGSTHIVQYALDTEMRNHPNWQADVGFPEGSNVGFVLPAGTYEGFGLNDNTNLGPDANNRADDDGLWNECRWHFIAPYAPLNVDKQVKFRPSQFLGWKSGAALSFNTSGTWAGKVSFWSCELQVNGKFGLRFSRKDTSPGGGLPAAPHTPMGTVVEFNQCLWTDHDNAPVEQPEGQYPTGEWVIHTFWTRVWCEDTEFRFRGMSEHAIYQHNPSPAPNEGGYRNCKFSGIGGQLFQESARDYTDTNPSGGAPWTSTHYEGEWGGRGTNRFENMVIDEGFNLVSIRAGEAFKCWGTGSDWIFDQVHVRRVTPKEDLVPQVVVTSSSAPSGYTPVSQDPQACVALNTNAYYGDDGLVFSAHRNHVHFPTHKGAFGRTNGSLTMTNCTWVIFHPAGNNKEMFSINSLDSATVTDTGIYMDPADPGGGNEVRVCEENVSTGGNDKYGVGEADVETMTWEDNNSPLTRSRADALFPGMTDGQLDSDPSVKEGCADNLQPGIVRGGVSANQTPRKWYEYPGATPGTEDAGNDPHPGGLTDPP